MRKVEQVPDTIEHLDFAPPCQIKFYGREGQNPATYMVCTPCGHHFLTCSRCVARKVERGRRLWTAKCCGCCWGTGLWLDFVTLHPLGGKP